MGGIHMSGRDFWEGLSEAVGFKTGLTLSRQEIASLFKSDERFSELSRIPARRDKHLRFHSVEYEQLFYFLLFKVGRLESDQRPFPSIDMHHRYKHDPKLHVIAMGVVDLFTKFLSGKYDVSAQNAIDPSPYILSVAKKYGKKGLPLAMEYLQRVNAAVIGSPWSSSRNVTWDKTIELKHLFETEGLVAPKGKFIDQRFLDFLNRNFERIDEIHWRKFEELSAEYFSRQGYDVNLGPGRNDGGVDLRVWPNGQKDGQPPTMLVQCKRQKTTVSRVILKALYADVIHEKATSGLIVTTSTLSPGAKADRFARAYPVADADRVAVREWIKNMRVPGAGVID